MLFEWIIYKALKDRQISRLHRFQVLFHSGITPVSRISSRNWYYITHQGKCSFSNYLAKYFFFTQTRPCMRVRKCEIPYLFPSTNCVGSLCLQQQRQCFISRSQYCNQKGREDSRSSSLFFFPYPYVTKDSIQLEIVREACEWTRCRKCVSPWAH